MTEFTHGMGWIPPSPEKRQQNMLYSFQAAGITAPLTVEKSLPLPDLVAYYDQHATPQCVGYSNSWMTSINALIHQMQKKFNATWLYNEACRVGNTSNGAYIWAAMDVLRKTGHVEVVGSASQPASLAYGIQSYIWAKNANDIRAAIAENIPCVFGIPWFKTFSTPTLKNGKYWIGLEGTDWGNIVGGHAICCYVASDDLEAVGLVNSWGADYAHPVYLPYNSVNRILSMEVPRQGECAVPLDRFVVPEGSPSPSPSPAPDEKVRANITVTAGGVTWEANNVVLKKKKG